ncbi:MAG: Gp138 family membrane-puncturing spike protein [Anaerotignaceae bacterium]
MDTSVFKRTINSMINQRIMDTHTNFIAKIVSIDINKMTIQPLSMYKVYGAKAQNMSVLTDVPVLCPYKYVYIVDKPTKKVESIEVEELKIGDTVYCGVCERDITESKNGNIALTSTGRHHNLSDSVVIMGLSTIKYVGGD